MKNLLVVTALAFFGSTSFAGVTGQEGMKCCKKKDQKECKEMTQAEKEKCDMKNCTFDGYGKCVPKDGAKVSGTAKTETAVKK